MSKRIMPLIDLQVKNAKPKEKDQKLSDGGGLYLLITPSGGKLWRLNLVVVHRAVQALRTVRCGSIVLSS